MTGTPERIVIPAPEVGPDERLVQFSFKHLDGTNPKFRAQDCPIEFWCAFMDRLKLYSRLTVEIFQDQNNPDRRHIIDFARTTEPSGFTSVDTDQLAYEQPWQFDLATARPWRIAGLLVEEIFYVVWLDPNHLLYD